MLSTIIIIATLIIYKINQKYHKYWAEVGIRYVRPWPLLGFMFGRIIRLKTYSNVIQDLCDTFPEQRYFGCYRYLTPILVVRDPALIGNVIIQTIETFSEKKLTKLEPETKQVQNWLLEKDSTINSDKLEELFVTVKEVVKQFITYNLNEDVVEVDMNDVTHKISNDILASIVFDNRLNSFKNPENQFFAAYKRLLESKQFSSNVCTNIQNIFKRRLCSRENTSFYEKLLQERRDLFSDELLQFLNEIRRELEKTQCSSEDKHHTKVTTNDIINLFIKFQTISNSICCLLYQLVTNPEVQNKLIREIDEFTDRHGPHISCQILEEMSYLNMLILEHLRLRPFVDVHETKLKRPLIVAAKNVWEKSVMWEGNTSVIVPISAIHHDPKNYVCPEMFNPERFNASNKLKIKANAYMPFGVCTEDCIGPRFTVMEMKTFIFYLLLNFSVTSTQSTSYSSQSTNSKFQFTLKRRAQIIGK